MINRNAAARAIEDFLRALGHEPVGDLKQTGERVAQAWADDLLDGYTVDVEGLLRDGSIEAEDARGQLIVLRDLAVTTMCPHHLLPAFGTGLVAYLPEGKVAGIGIIARVLDAFARRLTLQERIGTEVTSTLVRELGARGALCRLTLTHMCLLARGERKTGAIVETLSFGGAWETACAERELVMSAIRGG